ncbi:MAG TPA: hypothetical protein VNU97_13960 [Rhizomicrobium sp.]|jgi:hypothetical protein|nr:hypothetical protein [Rhizomicrobium sp.]
MRFGPAILLTLALAGCATSSGEQATGFLNPEIARAYIPLEGTTYVLMQTRGAAFVVAPGVAVTNAHNAGIVGKNVIGTSRNYDLLFFHVDRTAAPAYGAPTVGEQVIAYGQGAHGEVREAHGTVRLLNAPVEARCPTCIVQAAFTFEGNAGPGFSGGPVVDAASGRIVGITFGYLDPGGHRLMYAYPMSRVRNELAAIAGHLPVDVD